MMLKCLTVGHELRDRMRIRQHLCLERRELASHDSYDAPHEPDGIAHQADVSLITQLIQRSRAGNEQARDQVFGELQGFLEATVARHSNSQSAAKFGQSDIVQLSFVKAIEHFESFRGETGPEFRAWLKQLVINEIRQANRSLRRKVRDVSRETSLDAKVAAAGDMFAAVDPTPGTKAIRKEQIVQMQKAIGLLSDDYRRVIELRSFENKSLVEIAEVMNRSVAATTKLWFRAVLKLQSFMVDDDA